MDWIILSTFVISFVITLTVVPYWIQRARGAGIFGKDKHKRSKDVPEVGGLPVICGFLFAMLFYVAVIVFGNLKTECILINILAALLSILISTVIGIVDDILGWKVGLNIRSKIILTFFIALPIMVVNAGQSVMTFPIVGPLELGLLYPLLIIPIGIVGTSNGFNMLAGYNGLEAGQGIIILTTLGMISYLTGSGYVAVIAFSMVFALVAFYHYNRYPAKVFPGDTLTYSVGALIAIVAILGNIEKFALIIFIPYYIEFFLKARGSMNRESYGSLNKDGSLERPYKRYYGLEHIAIDITKKFKGKAFEKEVVYLLLLFQLFIACFTFLYYFL